MENEQVISLLSRILGQLEEIKSDTGWTQVHTSAILGMDSTLDDILDRLKKIESAIKSK